MNKLVIVAPLVPLLCNPVTAVELGPVRVSSYLNQPFKAVLSLDDVTALELAEIRFSLAGEDAYRRFNLLPPANLRKVKFKIVSAENGQYELHITSTQRVVEPILNILLQVNEKQGDFFRQYTLLIDPPQSVVAQAVARATTAPAETQTAPMPRLAVVDQPAAEVAEADTLLVRNRSISMIAQDSSLHDKYSVYQIMRAFYQLNSEAFEKGNINKLISGSRLVVPAASAVAEVPRQQAINFVYSVSRDHPFSAPVEESAVATAEVAPRLQRPRPDAAAALATSVDNSHSKQSMQRDVASWRSMSEEFTTLNGIVQHQNDALVSQHAVVKHISVNIDKHASLIEKLSTRLEHLETANYAPTVALEQESSVPSTQAEPIADPVTTQVAVNPPEIPSATDKSAVALEPPTSLSGPLATVKKTAEPFVGPVATALARPVPSIVTYVQPDDAGISRFWLGTFFVITLALLGLREWVWRRRFSRLGRADREKATTYSPSKDSQQMGTLEIRQIEAKDKSKSAADLQVTNKSNLRLESATADGVKIEIEVLLAYEQYEDALQLLGLSRDKFGEADWIDYKTLEIYAATNQCEEFLGLFNDKRVSLQAGSAIAWDKITRMRDQLCDEFKISAIG